MNVLTFVLVSFEIFQNFDNNNLISKHHYSISVLYSTKMSKKIRPGRVISDPQCNAIIVEYTVETLGDRNGHVR